LSYGGVARLVASTCFCIGITTGNEFAWLSLEEAAPRCLPAVVGESLRIVDAHLGQ
jgi:hypothetical protein